MSTTLRLSPFLRVGMQNGKLYFGFGSAQKVISLPGLQKAYLEVASEFASKGTISETDSLKSEVAKELISNKFVIPSDNYDPNDRYSRHHLYYLMSGGDNKLVQDKLKASHVIVLGCGGIGNLLATALAASGVGTITLVDEDDIELSNLTRQYLYSEADIGKYKVDVLKQNIEAKNSQCRVNTLKKHMRNAEDLELLPAADLVIVSADVDDICDTLNVYSQKHKVPWLNVGYVEDVAVWGPFVVPGKTGCTACHSNIANDRTECQETRDMIRTINRNYQAPSTGPINMLAISMAMFDIMRYLGGFGDIQSLNKRIGLWTHNLKFETQDYTKNHSCQVCGDV